MVTTRRLVVLAAIAALVIPVAAAAQTVRIIQTNSAGDNVHVIDPLTNEVIGVIDGIERAHGATPSPDGKKLYVANESDDTVDIVDMETLKVVKQVELIGRPNNIAITPDGSKVYTAIAESPGALQVLDTETEEMTAIISVHGGVHNTYVTPDGKYAIAGMVGGRNITVVSTETDFPVWTTYSDLGIRPMTMDVNEDGSTKHIYAQLSNFNGFGVLDFETRKWVNRIEYPEVMANERTPGPRRQHRPRHRRHPGPEVPRRQQQPEQQRVRLHPARPRAGGRRPRGPLAELGHHHPRQQVRVHLDVGRQQRRRHRHRDGRAGDQDRDRRTGSQAERDADRRQRLELAEQGSAPQERRGLLASWSGAERRPQRDLAVAWGVSPARDSTAAIGGRGFGAEARRLVKDWPGAKVRE